MSGVTDRTDWAGANETATLEDLLDHLRAMGRYAIGVGVHNAAAALAAADLLEEFATVDHAEFNFSVEDYRQAARP